MSRALHVFLTVLTLFGITQQSVHAKEPVLVFAAASLKETLEEAGKAFTTASGTAVIFSFASSGALAKQIEAGAPADLFASADLAWMDDAERKHLIRSESRTTLLGNDLVLIAPASSKLTQVEWTPESFAAALGDQRLATGEVNSVPAGIYAKAAFQNLGLWPFIEPRLAQTDNVRSALAFVARGETPLGVVYATDAKVESNVRIIAHFPDTSHAPIIYPFAITTASKNPDAEQFLNFLTSQKAKTIFEKAGFAVLVK
jgi:molybdate transport system substrate-binding protein